MMTGESPSPSALAELRHIVSRFSFKASVQCHPSGDDQRIFYRLDVLDAHIYYRRPFLPVFLALLSR